MYNYDVRGLLTTSRDFYQTDWHGNIEGYDYDDFGNPTGGNAANPFRYNGEYFDEETGFIYLRARYYDPGVGRFVSEDPIRDGTNWYAYCVNNPVNAVDPSGLDANPQWAIRIRIFNAADKDFAEALRVDVQGKTKEWRGFANSYVTHAISLAKRADSAFNYNWTGKYVTTNFKAKVVHISDLLGVGSNKYFV